MDFATCLRHYKRPEIQKAIVDNAKGREVAVKFADKGFGKRPEILTYPAEVLDFAKKGVTSFHISEERWKDVQQLNTGLKKEAMDDLRSGWDLVIDIDSTDWNISRIATFLIAKTLQDFDVYRFDVKFSGNKGFHIGVPFETFPKYFGNQSTRTLFPDLPKKLATYLIDYINTNYITIKDNTVAFADKLTYTLEKLKEITDKDVVLELCTECHKPVEKNTQSGYRFVCPVCQSSIISEEDFCVCEKCNKMMGRFEEKKPLCSCGSKTSYKKFNPLSVIDVDTLLLSSRHLYRSVYSLHEKSGLASVPVPVEQILTFEKENAHPDKVVGVKHFLEPGQEQAESLFKKITEDPEQVRRLQREELKAQMKSEQNYQELMEKAPEELFPPCIHNLLKGVSDGKKRCLFVLVNFLQNVGWSYDDIEERIREWNKNNPEPLRENMVVSHLRYHKSRRIMPPNCSNHAYYKDLHLCTPDRVCKSIKNPVNYTKRKVLFSSDSKK
ncbi:MAG: hypothetical protein R6V53_03530 [Candidatus Woesearchaeota archaeon]